MMYKISSLYVTSVLYVWWICLRLRSFFFFKQKTAYEMRISDWSSDVCSSDLVTTMLPLLPPPLDPPKNPPKNPPPKPPPKPPPITVTPLPPPPPSKPSRRGKGA